MRIEKVVLNKERENVYLEAYIADKLDSWEKNEFRKLRTQVKHLEKELQKEAPLRETAHLFYDKDNNPYKINI